MSKDIIIIGAGRQGFYLANELEQQGNNIIGFTDIKKPREHHSGFHLRFLGSDKEIFNYDPGKIRLVIALSDMNYLQKRNIFKTFKDKGYHFHSVVYSDAFVHSTAQIGEGVILLNRVFVGPYAIINDIAFVATSTSIEHDNIIGFNAYLSSGIFLGGSVHIGEDVMIGIGAKVLPSRSIGNQSVLGAGALLTKNIPENEIWYGFPAKFIRKHIK